MDSDSIVPYKGSLQGYDHQVFAHNPCALCYDATKYNQLIHLNTLWGQLPPGSNIWTIGMARYSTHSLLKSYPHLKFTCISPTILPENDKYSLPSATSGLVPQVPLCIEELDEKAIRELQAQGRFPPASIFCCDVLKYPLNENTMGRALQNLYGAMSTSTTLVIYEYLGEPLYTQYVEHMAQQGLQFVAEQKHKCPDKPYMVVTKKQY